MNFHALHFTAPLSSLGPCAVSCLIMWSSGTGFAGPGGYLLSIFVLSQLDGDSRVFVAECLVALFAVTYSWILPRPRPTPEARAIILSASSGRAQSHTQHDLRQSVLDHVLGSAETPLAAGAAGGASGMVPLASSAHNFPPDLPATTYFPEGVPRDSGGGLLPDVSPLMSNISEDHRTELGRASAAEQRASEQRASDKMDREHCGVTLESINQSMRDKDVMARNGADDDREPSVSSMSSLTEPVVELEQRLGAQEGHKAAGGSGQRAREPLVAVRPERAFQPDDAPRAARRVRQPLAIPGAFVSGVLGGVRAAGGRLDGLQPQARRGGLGAPAKRRLQVHEPLLPGGATGVGLPPDHVHARITRARFSRAHFELVKYWGLWAPVIVMATLLFSCIFRHSCCPTIPCSARSACSCRGHRRSGARCRRCRYSGSCRWCSADC